MPRLSDKRRREYNQIITLWLDRCSKGQGHNCEECPWDNICRATYDRIHNALDKLQGKKV